MQPLASAPRSTALPALPKAPTGIQGFDEITGGGLPKGRPTLVAGGAGCGKTLFGMEFLVRGALDHGEPGVFMAFEETAPDLEANVASLGFDLPDLERRGLLAIDHVAIDRTEIEEAGEYDLEGLFVRLGWAIDRVGARRVVLDTLEVLFSSLPNETVLRAELRRLFRWLKDRGVTAVITAERGREGLTRHGLEEYVSDCVVMLDHRAHDQVSTRRLRVVKYRGSVHGTNEYPFLIDEGGITVLPITSMQLDHQVSDDRISTGIASLDRMLGGQGFYRGSSVLVSGTAGAGKSSLAAHFVDAACRRGERALYLAFEESHHQIVRNMRSIGIDLEPWVAQGLLRFHTVRPTLYGLETHLAVIHKNIRDFGPRVVVVDPVTNLLSVGSGVEVKSALMRLIDYLKGQQITAFFTSLTSDQSHAEQTEVGISSLMDAWLLLRNIETNGERNRGLYVLKARGMAHSNQIREFRLTDHGVELVDVYLGTAGVLTGTARMAQEARERADAEARAQEIERRRREVERRRRLVDAQIESLRADFEAEAEALDRFLEQERQREAEQHRNRLDMAELRNGTAAPTAESGNL